MAKRTKSRRRSDDELLQRAQDLLTEGHVATREAKFGTATKKYEACRKVGRQLRSRGAAGIASSVEAAALGGLGRAYFLDGRHQLAISHHTEALDLSRSIGDRESEATHYGNLAEVYIAAEQSEEAVDACENAAGLLGELGNAAAEAKHRKTLGDGLYSLGRLGPAINAYSRAVSILHGTANAAASRTEVGQILGKLDNALDRLGHLKPNRTLASLLLDSDHRNAREATPHMVVPPPLPWSAPTARAAPAMPAAVASATPAAVASTAPEGREPRGRQWDGDAMTHVLHPETLAQTTTYAYPSSVITHLLERRRASIAERIAVNGTGAWRLVFRVLAAHGVYVSIHGFELRMPPAAASSTSAAAGASGSLGEVPLLPYSGSAAAALHAALDLLVFADLARPPTRGGAGTASSGAASSGTASSLLPTAGNARWARLLYEEDAPLWRRSIGRPPAVKPPGVRSPDVHPARPVGVLAGSSGASSGRLHHPFMDHDDDDPSSPLLRSLTVDGYLRIDDFGLNTTALRIQALSALEQNGRPGPEGDKALIGSPGVKLPALEPLLSNRTLQRVISRYLGGRVRFEGYTLFTLTEASTPETYASGHFHHDRCGRRLRMFVHIHDIDHHGRHTQAARGSHRTFAYYSYVDAYGLTRFSPDYVRSRYEVVSLTGPAGGGFLLDTNGLHRAQLSGRARTAIQLEWHAKTKVPNLATHPASAYLQCPTQQDWQKTCEEKTWGRR